MNSEYTGANYNFAKAEADKIDAQIIETLKSGHSFRVEAGAGSGKTYSLNGCRQINGLITAEKNRMWYALPIQMQQ